MKLNHRLAKRSRLPICFLVLTMITTSPGLRSTVAQEKLPDAETLPIRESWPDPLITLDGKKIATAEDWNRIRRPELKQLFQHYMYGFFPAPPTKVEGKITHENTKYFGGKATLREVTISWAPAPMPTIQLLLVIPNQRKDGRVPAFTGINFCGNHTLLDDPTISLPKVWMPSRCPGCEKEVATDAGRGKQADVWALEQSIDRGYAVATFYNGDIDPDKPDFTDGVHPHYLKPNQTAPGQHDWGTIAAWAWGIHRVVDYLQQLPEIDPTKIAAVGHSRNGKTALLAAAFDERIALAVPAQAGCGGTAPSRGKIGESVKAINDRFPHWFCDEFTKFNDNPNRLPFDQHCLVALCAPRPVLFTNAVEDTWANPDGQFDVLQAASPVYQLLKTDGLAAKERPAVSQLLDSTLGYYIRPGKHSMTTEDWKVYLDFADKHFHYGTRAAK